MRCEHCDYSRPIRLGNPLREVLVILGLFLLMIVVAGILPRTPQPPVQVSTEDSAEDVAVLTIAATAAAQD